MSQVSLPARSILVALAASFVFAAPASASQVLEFHGGGRLVPHENPYLPPPAGPEAALTGSEQACPAPAPAPPALPKLHAARGPSVDAAVAKAARGHRISASRAASYRRIYAAARSARSQLSGRNRRELSAVITVLEGIAARGQLTAGRMPALFLQLDRNRQFWHGKPAFPVRTDLQPDPCTRPPSNNPAGARIVFEGSPVVYQYYPGQGIQLQPLANFGMANGMITGCRHDPTTCDRAGLKQLLDEMVAIRSSRGGFVTWEYWFYFGGGTPPWTSGLSSGTAIQALARASEKSILDDKSYLRVAHGALGVFQTAPPVGVRLKRDGGSHYLIYSFDPGLRVLNGFLQAITGLFDYAKVAKDPVARKLYKAGDRAAQHELHRFDTGKWSLYSEGGAESSLGYHRLVTGFLDDLCKRLKGKYCTYHDRFRSYLGDKPAIAYSGDAQGTAGTPLALRYKIDKPACVTIEVTDSNGTVVFRDRRKVARGTHSVKWTPDAAGTYTLTIGAVDQNKNATSPDFPLVVQ
ncbi:MAG: hypothetical protein QOC95_1427 [Thermoleophilaceae bacterium]|nr:hypothetical protein [Thermoleophilaceae bacterium]